MAARIRTHGISSEERKMFSNWCQDYSSVKNNMVSRDDILMEVNKILQTLNSIVYKLSVSRSQSEMNINVCQENISEFHHEEMWWDDAYVSLSMSVSQDVNNNNNNSNNLINNSECSSALCTKAYVVSGISRNRRASSFSRNRDKQGLLIFGFYFCNTRS